MRQNGNDTMVVVAARFPARRAERGGRIDALVRLPEGLAGLDWREVLSSSDAETGPDGLALDTLLAGVAVAVLVASE